MRTIILLCLILPRASAQKSLPSDNIVLSMMEGSVDDRFYHCIKKTAKKVEEVYFPREMHMSVFGGAWSAAETCAQKNLDQIRDEDKALTKEHLQAICVYTANSPDAYGPLNQALRDLGKYYSTEVFQLHALYFWLTSAVQNLKKSCETTYRRTRLVHTGKVGQVIRFGYFASSSRSPTQTGFGSESCFHIRTCLGAHIAYYSVFFYEDEVLIPPYEKFKIMKVLSGNSLNPYVTYDGLTCKTIFVLKNAGSQSKLNCKAANHNQQIRANFTLILSLQLLIGWMWNCVPHIKI